MSDDQRPPEHDADLELLGATLRAQGRPRTGDLAALAQRSRDRQRRRRVGVAVLGALMVLGVAGAVARGTTRGAADLVVGGAPSGATAVSSIAPVTAGTSATVPPWTVNPSIPIDAEQVWTARVAYERAVWNDQRFSELFDLAQPYGANAMADHRDAPVVDLYWKDGGLPPGQDPRPKVEAAAAAIRSLPGIVSVEVGTAVPTKRVPATSAPFPNGSTPSPTSPR